MNAKILRNLLKNMNMKTFKIEIGQLMTAKILVKAKDHEEVKKLYNIVECSSADLSELAEGLKSEGKVIFRNRPCGIYNIERHEPETTMISENKEKTTVFFQTKACDISEQIAVFQDEEIYNICLPTLKKWAAANRGFITETTDL
jgi:hypothetical protein